MVKYGSEKPRKRVQAPQVVPVFKKGKLKMDEDPRGKVTTKMTNDFSSRFLRDRDDTGRFIEVSRRTGRRYYVEAIGDPHISWGSIIPGDDSHLAVKKGWGKNKGSIEPEESLITEENGFSKIHNLEPGISPHAYIDMLDAKYPDKV